MLGLAPSARPAEAQPALRRFANKIAIVTGGASGIGAAFARRVHGEGATVMIVDLDAVRGMALVGELGDRATFERADVTDAPALVALADATAATFGGIDILFNNAGTGCYGLTPDLAVDDWRRVIAINLDAVFYGCRAVIPHLVARGGGVIVNTASASGIRADFGFTAYNAAKAGVINYTRSLAIDHARDGIRANAVCPGPVDTPLLAHMNAMPGLRSEWESAIPSRRFARAEEVAAVAAFLASDDSSGVTGAAVPVDGGLTAHTGQPDLRDRMAEFKRSSGG